MVPLVDIYFSRCQTLKLYTRKNNSRECINIHSPESTHLAGLQMGLYAAAADSDDCGLVEAVIPEWRPSEPEGEARPPEK